MTHITEQSDCRAYSTVSTVAKGRIGEDAAAAHYIKSGYSVLERNWHWSNRGELDIIALSNDGGILAICEVKARKKDSMTMPCEAVNAAKIKKIKTLAEIYVLKNRELVKNAAVRFDVAEVTLAGGSGTLENIIYNAF